VDIGWLDLADRRAVDDLVELWGVVHSVDHPADPPFAPLDARGSVLQPQRDEPASYRLLRDDGGLLAAATIGLPQLDNTGAAFVELVVHPRHRRRGLGSLLWSDVAERCQAARRKLALFDTPADGPGAAFAGALGAEPALVDARRRLVIDTATRRQDLLLTREAEPRAVDYVLHSWSGAAPENWLDGLAHLTGRMSTDAPLGDLAWEPEFFDGARIRAREARAAAVGRRTMTTIAVHHATGTVVAFTTIAVPVDSPIHGWQHDTLVDPAHRGHRLGTLIKVANLEHALTRVPRLRMLMTWNAEANAPMIAVNEAMGYRLWDRWIEWQLRL
jgi:GNAT superfamily N-acetyltransferase